MRVRTTIIVACLIGLAAGLAGLQQALADDDSSRAEFDKDYARFKELLKQATEYQERYVAASESERTVLAEKFNEVVREGNKLRPKLKVLAEKVYKQDPKDKEMGDMMMAVVTASLHADDYEEAFRVAKILIDNRFPQPQVYSLAGAAAFALSNYDAAENYLNKAAEAGALDENGQKVLQLIPESRDKWNRESALRDAEAKANNLPRVRITVGDSKGHPKGDIVVELFENEAPNTVANFIHLVEKKFYDGLTFHRVLGGFMAQAGDPKGDGSGGPGYHIACECYDPNHRDHFRGSLSMAHAAARDTGGSQFFINFTPTPWLDGKHTVFGRVIEGMDVLAKIQRIDPNQPAPGVVPDKIIKAVVIRKRAHAYDPKTLPEEAATNH